MRADWRRAAGFTLVELMIVVAIIGLLAAIAIPAFSRYVKKARTSEAVHTLNKLWAGSVTYYEADHVDESNNVLDRQFPQGAVPGILGALYDDPTLGLCGCRDGGKCPGGSPWAPAAATFDALNFTLPDPHLYLAGYLSQGFGTSSVFLAVAFGDLECDSALRGFLRQGGIDPATGDVMGAAPAFEIPADILGGGILGGGGGGTIL